MRKLLFIPVILLAGCATNPDTERSMSRDRTAESLAKTALISEMLKSEDPVVRSKGAEAAQEFLKKEKSIFNWR